MALAYCSRSEILTSIIRLDASLKQVYSGKSWSPALNDLGGVCSNNPCLRSELYIFRWAFKGTTLLLKDAFDGWAVDALAEAEFWDARTSRVTWRWAYAIASSARQTRQHVKVELLDGCLNSILLWVSVYPVECTHEVQMSFSTWFCWGSRPIRPSVSLQYSEYVRFQLRAASLWFECPWKINLGWSIVSGAGSPCVLTRAVVCRTVLRYAHPHRL